MALYTRCVTLFRGPDIYTYALWQVMRMASAPPSPPSVKERKISQSASSKIDSIIKQLFLPMLDMPTPEKTSFQLDDDTALIRQVAEECPGALASESDFVDYMVVLYRKFNTSYTTNHATNHATNHTKTHTKTHTTNHTKTHTNTHTKTHTKTHTTTNQQKCGNHDGSNHNDNNNNMSTVSDNKRLDPLLPVAGHAMLALELPVEAIQDGSDLPKTLAHAVGASAH